MHLAVRELGIDLVCHGDHLTRDFLLGIFIAGEVALNVTVVALHAEAGGKGPHDLNDFGARGDFQHLQVGRVRPGTIRFVLLLRSFVLSKKGQ